MRDRPERGGNSDRGERLTGTHAIREALAAARRPLHRLRVRDDDRRPELAGLIAAARAAGIPVERTSASTPREVPEGERSGRGLELDVGPLPELSLGDLLRPSEFPRTLVALDGVEDPQNVGAIARVAEGAGAAGLILTRRRAPPLSPAVARASAGAIEWLPVARVANLPRALNDLKSNGFWVFGCDPSAADALFELPDRLLRGDRVVVLGAEGKGLRRGVAQVLDHRVRVPMAGRVESLNVAAAAAVLLFEFRRRSDLATSA